MLSYCWLISEVFEKCQPVNGSILLLCGSGFEPGLGYVHHRKTQFSEVEIAPFIFNFEKNKKCRFFHEINRTHPIMALIPSGCTKTGDTSNHPAHSDDSHQPLTQSWNTISSWTSPNQLIIHQIKSHFDQIGTVYVSQRLSSIADRRGIWVLRKSGESGERLVRIVWVGRLVFRFLSPCLWILYTPLLILTYTVRAMCYPPALSLSVLKVIPFYPITIGTSASRGAINVADISVQW